MDFYDDIFPPKEISTHNALSLSLSLSSMMMDSLLGTRANDERGRLLLAPIDENEASSFNINNNTASKMFRNKCALFVASAALFALSTVGVASVSSHALFGGKSNHHRPPRLGTSKAIEKSFFEVFGRADVHRDPSSSSASIIASLGRSRHDDDDDGDDDDYESAERKTAVPLPSLGASSSSKKASNNGGPHVQYGAYKALNEVYEPVLDVPVVFIALRDNDEDLWKVRRTIETLAGETRVNYEDLAETVSVSQGIDARKWPRDIANAEYAVKDIRKLFHKKVKDGTVFASDVKDFYQLMGLLKHIDTRKADGSLDQFSIDKGLSHHVGCLYAHLYQWQWVKDQGWPIAWIMESDGNKMTNVPFWAVQTLTENMPKEADVLFLQNFMREPGFEGPHYKSVGVKGPNGAYAKIDIYKMNTRTSALSGLQSYVITQNFIKKAHNFIATYGADMVDAFTAGNMCAYKDWWNQADISKGEKPILNCFQALSKPIEVEGVKQTMVAG